jgi:hypothetical protein
MSTDAAAAMIEMFRFWPRPPYKAEPYDAVRGITWTIVDGSGQHFATVFEEEAAKLIVARLNQ